VNWHGSRHGKVKGPFTEPEMFELIGKRQIAAGDQVDANKAGNWWPIETVPTFARSFVAPAAIVQHVPVYHPPQPPQPAYLPDSVCVHCGRQGMKVTKSRMTSTGAATFWICLLLCMPVSLIAIFTMRERYSFCQGCGSH
jgi:hypothetical protein